MYSTEREKTKKIQKTENMTMTKTELKKLAKEEGYDFDYILDVKNDMESDGIKTNWQLLADMMFNGDI